MAKSPPPLLLSLSLLLLLSAAPLAIGRRLVPSSVLLISDGISAGGGGTSPGTLAMVEAAGEGEEKCEQTYGFLPCTTTVMGNLFLVIAYGFLMFKGATYLSAGSELLLEILGPGIVGGLFLPILGALPDAMLILVSGLSGTKEEAQKQILIGIGLLAGSTVMLLTLLWGSCVVVAKCDLSENSTSVDLQDTKRFSLFVRYSFKPSVRYKGYRNRDNQIFGCATLLN